MAKITVKVPHVTSDIATAELTACYGQREISDAVAVTVASWHQSPGTVGRVLAALASGATVEHDELADDIYMTRGQIGQGSVNRRDLDQLSTWAIARTQAGTVDYSTDAPAMRYAVTARWSNGNGQTDELSYMETRDELDALKRSLDGLAPGDAITIRRLS